MEDRKRYVTMMVEFDVFGYEGQAVEAAERARGELQLYLGRPVTLTEVEVNG